MASKKERCTHNENPLGVGGKDVASRRLVVDGLAEMVGDWFGQGQMVSPRATNAEQFNCAALSTGSKPFLRQKRHLIARGAVLKMVWCGGDEDGVRHTLCQGLEALLQRDRSFAQSFVKDRRALQRIAKLIVQETDAKQPQYWSRMERSAGLHCIVLAFRLARIDKFAAEVFLPILIAGSLSGVVQYLPGCPRVGQENQQHPMGTEACLAYRNADEYSSSPKTTRTSSALWPSTSLSSAQELAAHAVVNPLVSGRPKGNSRWLFGTNDRVWCLWFFSHLLDHQPAPFERYAGCTSRGGYCRARRCTLLHCWLC